MTPTNFWDICLFTNKVTALCLRAHENKMTNRITFTVHTRPHRTRIHSLSLQWHHHLHLQSTPSLLRNASMCHNYKHVAAVFTETNESILLQWIAELTYTTEKHTANARRQPVRWIWTPNVRSCVCDACVLWSIFFRSFSLVCVWSVDLTVQFARYV